MAWYRTVPHRRLFAGRDGNPGAASRLSGPDYASDTKRDTWQNRRAAHRDIRERIGACGKRYRTAAAVCRGRSRDAVPFADNYEGREPGQGLAGHFRDVAGQSLDEPVP